MRVYVRIGASVLGLVAIGCDFILTRRGEAQYIWTKPLRVTVVRCLFILIRYLPIAIHIIGLIFCSERVYRYSTVPEEYCMDILVIEIIASYIMLVLLEVVLMLRVFALYDRSRTIGIFLVAVLVSRIAGSVYTIEERVLKFQAVKITFPGYCVARFSFKHPLGNPVCSVHILSNDCSVVNPCTGSETHHVGPSSIFPLVVFYSEQRWSDSVRRYWCSNDCNRRGDSEARSAKCFHTSAFHLISFCCRMPQHSQPAEIRVGKRELVRAKERPGVQYNRKCKYSNVGSTMGCENVSDN
ncbi:hypothetical protein BDP27DRAFT_1412108 [Rhodocollybia butyracea]|uniref:DUF6533 domain-containing protein n=1 Tax=Rhodocollybia butyracea TaxID=206335 RepID=A0A9P5P2V3_9AGAR|nr:hypothetical protein BDP27DRAFT_1412108 [Rhodocollybia butyracea]